MSGSINSNYFNHSQVISSMGDSLTSSGNWQARLISRLGGYPWSSTICAYSGDTTFRMLARHAEMSAVRDSTYVVYFGGINDIIGGFSAASIQSNLQSMYNQGKYGYTKVVAITVLPFKGNQYWTEQRQLVLSNVNLWIMTSATNVDSRVDAYSALEDPAIPGALLAWCVGPDLLHLNINGYNALGDCLHTNMTWVLYPSLRESTLSLSGPNPIYLNQSLRPNDAPTFRGIHVGPKLLDATGVYPMSLGIGTNSPTDGQFLDVGLPMRTVDIRSSGAVAVAMVRGIPGVGVNINGGPLVLSGGAQTGTGKGGSIDVKTYGSAAASGSTPWVQTTRHHYEAGWKDLTEDTNTVFCRIDISSGNFLSGKWFCAIEAKDGNGYQVLSSDFSGSAYYRTTPPTVGGTNQVDRPLLGGGTLTAAYSITPSGSTSVDIGVTSTSSLAQTSLRIWWQCEINGDGTATVTAQ